MDARFKFDLDHAIPISFSMAQDGVIEVQHSALTKFVESKAFSSKYSSAVDCIDEFIFKIQDDLHNICKKITTRKNSYSCHPMQLQTNNIQIQVDILNDLEKTKPEIFDVKTRGPTFYPMEKMAPAVRPAAKKLYPKVLDKMIKSCRSTFSEKFFGYSVVAMSKTFMQDYLLPYLKNGDFDSCKREIVSSYTDWFDAAKNLCSDNSESEENYNCARFTRAYNEFVNSFLSEVPDSETVLASFYCGFDPQDQNNGLDYLKTSLEQIANCYELKQGEFKKVNKQQPGLTQPNYRLIKRDNFYEAQVNLDFSPASKQADFEKLTKDCINAANQDLKDYPIPGLPPGMQLKLGHSSLAPKSKIRIEAPEFRSHAGAWESDIDCSTIIHEIGHLLGLVDEYVENDPKLPKNACRIISDPPTVMGSNSLFLNNMSRSSEFTLFSKEQISSIIFPGCTSGPKYQNNEKAYACMSLAYKKINSCRLDEVPGHCGLPAAAHLKVSQ